MRLILTRHGETVENRNKIYQGHMPGTLSELGIEQGRKLAERFKEEKIDAIFCSDLARASDTAKLVAEFHPNIPVISLEILREGALGEGTGKPHGTVDWNNTSGVESHAGMLNRAELFISQLQDYKNKTVFVVSHGGLIKALFSVLLKDNKLMEEHSQGNTAVNIFQLKEDGNISVDLFNCTRHLN